MDRQAVINHIYEQNYESFTYYAFRYLKDRDLAKDMVQEAYLQLIAKADAGYHIKHPKTYFYVAIKNLCLNILRDQQIQRKHHLQLREIPTLPSIEDEIINHETQFLVADAISQLSGQQQKVILLSMASYQNEEIASALKISINTVKTNKQRGYGKLKKFLKNI